MIIPIIYPLHTHHTGNLPNDICSRPRSTVPSSGAKREQARQAHEARFAQISFMDGSSLIVMGGCKKYNDIQL